MSATILFYEGSYQFDCIKTDLRVTKDFIAFKLQKALENRDTKEKIWAELNDNGIVSRFAIDSDNNVTQYVFVDSFGDSVKKTVVGETETHFLLEDGSTKMKSWANTKRVNETKKVNEIIDKALITAFEKASKETELSRLEIYQSVLDRLQSLSNEKEGNANQTHLSTLVFGF